MRKGERFDLEMSVLNFNYVINRWHYQMFSLHCVADTIGRTANGTEFVTHPAVNGRFAL